MKKIAVLVGVAGIAFASGQYVGGDSGPLKYAEKAVIGLVSDHFVIPNHYAGPGVTLYEFESLDRSEDLHFGECFIQTGGVVKYIGTVEEDVVLKVVSLSNDGPLNGNDCKVDESISVSVKKWGHLHDAADRHDAAAWRLEALKRFADAG